MHRSNLVGTGEPWPRHSDRDNGPLECRFILSSNADSATPVHHP